MKTIFKSILAVLATVFIASSCSDVPAPYNMPGEGDNGGGSETTSVIFEQDFSKGQGDFTIKNITKPENLQSEIWTYQSQYKSMVAKAYIDGNRYATESILASPEIDLSSYNEDLKVTINNASNYFASLDVMKQQAQVVVSTDDGATWEPLTLSEYAKNDKEFTFVNSEASLTPYAGKKIKLGFKYTSTVSQTGTWEISKVTIEKGKAAEGETDTPSTGDGEGTKANPYNVAGALAKTADAGKQAWVKGYIVGYMKSIGSGNVAEFAGGGQDDKNKDYNVLIADSKDIKDVAKCMAVKLNKAIRPNVGLQTNEANLGKEISLYGTFAANKYGGMFILDNATAAILDGTLVGTDPDAGGGETPSGSDYVLGASVAPANITAGTYAIGYTYKGTNYLLKHEVYSNYYVAAAAYSAGSTVDAKCILTVEKVDNGFRIKGYDNKYLGMTVSGTHVNLVPTEADGSTVWTFSAPAASEHDMENDCKMISNKSAEKFLIFSWYSKTSTAEFTTGTYSSQYVNRYPVFYKLNKK